MEYFAAIDIGASSGRLILGWLEDGKLRTEEVYRFRNGAVMRSRRLVWRADVLFNEVLNGLKRCKEIGKIPAYVGIDTWAVDYALLDENDNRVGPVYCYRDGRTKEAVPAVHRLVPHEELYARTGIQFQPFNTLYQLHADKRGGRTDFADTLLMFPDYLHFLLTGVKMQEYTNATSTGLVNARTHDWDRELIGRLGIEQKLFGKLYQPGTAVGPFTPAVEREVGFAAVVMLPATHDTASAVLAAPLEGQTPYLSSGTWSLLGIEQDFARTDDASRLVNWSNEGSVSGTFRYQKNIMGLWMIQSVRREMGEKYSFSQLATMARAKEYSGIVDVNDDRFLAPESMTEEVDRAMGKTLGVATRMRVLYDSLAASYKQAIDELERNTGKTYETLNIIGGGTKDTFLTELTAAATGKRVITGPTEATAIGNLMMQMIGAGVIKDVKEGRSIIKNSFEIKETV